MIERRHEAPRGLKTDSNIRTKLSYYQYIRLKHLLDLGDGISNLELKKILPDIFPGDKNGP